MPAKLKLTFSLVDQIVELKRDCLCDADIIAAIGVHQATFYRLLKEGENAKTGVKRALYEELKKAEAQYWTAAAWLLERKYSVEYCKMELKAEEADNASVQLMLGLVIEPMADDSDGEGGGELAEPAEHGRPDARGEDRPYPWGYAGEREQAYRCRALGTVAEHWHDQEQRHRNVQQAAHQRRITKRKGPPFGLRSRHDLVRAYELVYRH